MERTELLEQKTLLNKETLKEHLVAPENKKFYCVTTHNPLNPPVQDTITNNWEILGKTKTSRPILDAEIIFGLRRNKNLSDHLVRASTSAKNNENRPKRIDSRPCNRSSTCRYCPLLNTTGSFVSKRDNLTYTSKININCQTCNCIYLITCSHCGTQCVGQTKNKLLTRFNSHFFDISHNKDTTVARHFNKCPPQNPAKTDGLIISVLSFIRALPDTKAGQTERDMEEKRWIHRLASVVPRGLNLLD